MSDAQLLRNFLRSHELTFCDDMGAIMVFDAPPDYCGVVIDLDRSVAVAWVHGLVDRGWCAVQGGLNDVVRKLSELYSLESTLAS